MNRKGSVSNIRSRGSSKDRQSQIEPTRKKKSLLCLNRLSKVSLGNHLSVATPLKGFGTPAKAQHRSLAPVDGINRLSFRASGFGMPAKKNPWEVSDPAFKSKCIDKVLEFLNLNNFSLPVTRNTLKSPTAKDFSTIFTFVYQFLDPYFKLTKMEEQIPKLMKIHSFPGQLTKSTFLNVGSPHAWPNVLAMLAFLCDIAPCIQSDNLIQSMFQKDFESEKSLVEQKINVAIAFYSSPEENFSNIVQEYKVEMENIMGITDEDYQKALATEKDCAAKLEEVPCLEEELMEMKEQYYKLQVDCEKLVEYEEKISVFLSEKDKERITLEKQRNDLQNAVDQVEENMLNLKQHENNQNLSEEEVQKIKSYKQQYISAMKYYKQEESDLMQKQWKEETELSKLRMNNWSTLVCEFASKSRQIGFDASFLSNGDSASFNNNKDEVVVEMKNSLAKLVRENALTNDALADTATNCDQYSDRLNCQKKKVIKLEKATERSNEEKKKLKIDINIQSERLQTEVDHLAEDILRMRRGSEFNSCRQDELKALVTEYKSSIEKNIITQEELKATLRKKKQDADLFLTKKAEIVLKHNKTMEAMYQNYVPN